MYKIAEIIGEQKAKEIIRKFFKTYSHERKIPQIMSPEETLTILRKLKEKKKIFQSTR